MAISTVIRPVGYRRVLRMRGAAIDSPPARAHVRESPRDKETEGGREGGRPKERERFPDREYM